MVFLTAISILKVVQRINPLGGGSYYFRVHLYLSVTFFLEEHSLPPPPSPSPGIDINPDSIFNVAEVQQTLAWCCKAFHSKHDLFLCLICGVNEAPSRPSDTRASIFLNIWQSSQVLRCQYLKAGRGLVKKTGEFKMFFFFTYKSKRHGFPILTNLAEFLKFLVCNLYLFIYLFLL